MDQRGFNRIEVLVLVVIVIALLMLAIFFILELQSNVRDTKRRADIETISQALEAHYNRQDKEHCETTLDAYCRPKGDWFYNDQIPLDPLTGTYLNLPDDGDKKYLICAKLENGGGNALSSQVSPSFGAMANFYCHSNQQ